MELLLTGADLLTPLLWVWVLLAWRDRRDRARRIRPGPVDWPTRTRRGRPAA